VDHVLVAACHNPRTGSRCRWRATRSMHHNSERRGTGALGGRVAAAGAGRQPWGLPALGTDRLLHYAARFPRAAAMRPLTASHRLTIIPLFSTVNTLRARTAARLVQNSWGPSWNINGRFKVRRQAPMPPRRRPRRPGTAMQLRIRQLGPPRVPAEGGAAQCAACARRAAAAPAWFGAVLRHPPGDT
jgi:hypothetical protein